LPKQIIMLNKDKLISDLQERLLNLEKAFVLLRQENIRLKDENKILKYRVSELKARCKSNSSNSSRPPSSDGYQKKPAFPRKSKGKNGGQKGHKGNNLKQILSANKTVKCIPKQCECGHIFNPSELKISEKRQVFDIPKPQLYITEYQIYKGRCSGCGKIHRGVAPQGVTAPTQYGNGVKSFVVMLNAHFNIPYKKIQLLFKDLFGYPINESTIYSANEKCFTKLKPSEDIIKEGVISSGLGHSDESGVRVEGKLQWLHVFSNRLYTHLFIHPKRGLEAMQSNKSALNNFFGWLIHDHYHSYFKFSEINHALCGAHILRELQGVVDGENKKWARIFHTFLMQVYNMSFEERIHKKQNIKNRYMQICELGEKTEPLPIKTKGRKKRTKGRNLVERLIKEQDMVLAFAFDENIPFTNNLAERDVRPIKTKQKVSSTFRSAYGADMYARIQSFISTARKNNKNVFDELHTTFDGYNFLTEAGK